MEESLKNIETILSQYNDGLLRYDEALRCIAAEIVPFMQFNLGKDKRVTINIEEFVDDGKDI